MAHGDVKICHTASWVNQNQLIRGESIHSLSSGEDISHITSMLVLSNFVHFCTQMLAVH